MELDGQVGMFADNPEYDAFVEKFKRKATTDDCFTPPLVYAAVRDWACAEYGIDPAWIVRPFWPDTDYRRFECPDGCVVLDNPPFSILTPICEFYLAKDIPFFLFAPALTCLSSRATTMKTTHIFSYCQIVYENGAAVNTAFITNLGGDIVAMSSPSLYRAVKAAVDATARQVKPSLPKYSYPGHVLTASTLNTMARYGVPFAVRARDCCRVSALDSQRTVGKAIFGGGLLLSNAAAAEKAAAEKAAVTVWELSARELAIVEKLGEQHES